MDNLETLLYEERDGVAIVTMNRPDVYNAFNRLMERELQQVWRSLRTNDDVRAVVVRSADPEFFIAHADLALIQALPRDRRERSDQLEFIHVFMERWRTLPQVTIAQLEGRARGGGSEFALSLDLRFGAVGRAILGQPEVAVGILPGGSGTQRLPRLIGRARALEVVLGCEDFDAELAERYGYINRALPAAELGPFVDRLARRIAAFPAHAVDAETLRLGEDCLRDDEPIPVLRRRLADQLDDLRRALRVRTG